MDGEATPPAAPQEVRAAAAAPAREEAAPPLIGELSAHQCALIETIFKDKFEVKLGTAAEFSEFCFTNWIKPTPNLINKFLQDAGVEVPRGKQARIDLAWAELKRKS